MASTLKTKRNGDDMILSYQRSIPKYIIYQGVPFPGAILTKRLPDIRSFNVRPDDIVLCGYPRSGNHWLKEILTMLCADDISPSQDVKDKHVFERIPLLEMAVDLRQCMETYMENYFQKFGPLKEALSKAATTFGLISVDKMFSQSIYLDPLDDLDKRPSPRIYHTHLPYRLLPRGARSGTCKMIYIIRNGKDVATSFYEMHKMYPPFGYYSGDWKEFFYTFLSGKVCFGSWFEHTQDWWRHAHEHNILFIKYEDMIENLPREITRVAIFLNKSLTPGAIDDIADKCTFHKMKENPMSTYDGLHSSIDTRKTSFLRKGKVGDWKSKLTVEDSEYFDLLLEEHISQGEFPEVRYELQS